MTPVFKCFVIVLVYVVSLSSIWAYKIVVSIAPLAALTRAIVGDQATVETLVDQAVSPHVYALKPSDLRKMNQADIIFWIGPAYESFLKKPLQNFSTKTVDLFTAPSLKIYNLRFSDGAHEAACDHNCLHDHDPLKHDGHVWLDPDNGIALAQEIMKQLSALHPSSHPWYQMRFEKFKQSVEKTKHHLQNLLRPYQNKGFLVFHDGYQYFERAFGLANGHVMSLMPDISPSIKRMKELKTLIDNQRIVVLFGETQFSPQLMNVLADETGLKIGLLDPLGSSDNTYQELLINLATSFSTGFNSAIRQGSSS